MKEVSESYVAFITATGVNIEVRKCDGVPKKIQCDVVIKQEIAWYHGGGNVEDLYGPKVTGADAVIQV